MIPHEILLTRGMAMSFTARGGSFYGIVNSNVGFSLEVVQLMELREYILDQALLWEHGVDRRIQFH